MTLELEFLDQIIMGNSLLQWLFAVTALLLSYLLLRMAKHIAGRRLAAFATRTETPWDDVVVQAINKTKPVFLLIAGIFIGSLLLQLPERISRSFITCLSSPC